MSTMSDVFLTHTRITLSVDSAMSTLYKGTGTSASAAKSISLPLLSQIVGFQLVVFFLLFLFQVTEEARIWIFLD